MLFLESMKKDFVEKIIAVVIAIMCVRCISQNAHKKLPYLVPSFARVNQGEDIWISSYLGEVSSFGYFLKKNLMLNDPKQIVLLPEPGSTGADFIKNKLWKDMLSMYLYPSIIETCQKKALILNHGEYEYLISKPRLTQNYMNERIHKIERRFHIIKSHLEVGGKQWGIFVYRGKNTINFFCMPLDWETGK